LFAPDSGHHGPAVEPLGAGALVEADFWPEGVRVVATQPRGSWLKVEAVGVRSGRFYSRLLAPKELERIRVAPPAGRDLAGRAEAFFLGIEAQRIRHAFQFDSLYAVNVSQIDALPHQIEAVYHYILRHPRVRFLLADDPGAGKTIMAGLVIKELKARGLVRRTLIVVPGQLRERFAEAFTVVDRAVVSATWGRNVWQEYDQVITSIDFAKQDEVLPTLEVATWDLAIVDEAHKMAAYRYGEKLSKTERYRLGEALSCRSQFLLFLTATPHRGDPENFRLFLDLLEPDFFATRELLQQSVIEQDNPLFLRRLKEDLKKVDGTPLFPPRHVITRPFHLSDDEKRLYNAVTTYVERSYNRALAAEKRNVAFALLVLQRRLASSVRAARLSLERRKKRLEELLRLGTWYAERGQVDEDELEDAPEEERLRREEELLERLTAAETREELQHEIDQLGELIRLARQAERNEVETKLAQLRQVMEAEQLRQTGEKLLIFTEARDTLDYLAEKLRAWGLSIETLHGGLSLDRRIAAEHAFRDRAQVMISTEAGGEGINLQFCALMINYDIPWNPNRLEQRLGRIHRYGQEKEVYVYNLVAEDTREGGVLAALFHKLSTIQAALGSDRVFDVIGDVLPGVSLKDLIVDAVANRRTLDEIIATLERVPDEEIIRRVREASLEALATRHLDLQGVLGEERRARESRLVPEYIERFFERASAFLELRAERRRDGLWRLERVPFELRQVAKEHGWGPLFEQYLKLAFDKPTARQQGAEFIAPGHPLLETMVEQLLTLCAPDLARGAVFADPDGRRDGLLWFLQLELRDGTDAIAGQRLVCVYQPAGAPADLRLVPPAILWDLVPSSPASPLPELWERGPGGEGPVLTFAVDAALEPYRRELLAERQREAAVKRKYGLRSLDQLLLESEAKLLDYATRRAKGEEVPEPTIQHEERVKEDLQAKKRRLEEALRLETTLAPAEPRLIGAARVVPAAADPALAETPDIEAIGMQVALAYERAQGRSPEDVSSANLGYDIRSTAPDGAVRYIEVKARARTGAIALTPNEWLMAQRLGGEYWLYVVEQAATAPELYVVQDPAAKLHPDKVVEVVRYVVRDWKEAAAR
jgi:superfamily II DNA or RNA helicase